MTLGIADVDRWDPQTVRDVAAAADSRAAAADEASRLLGALPVFADWAGLAASAARLSVAVTRAQLDAHAATARAVARAAHRAADAIVRLKADLRRIEDDAHTEFLEIDHGGGAVRPAPGFRGSAADFDTRCRAVADRLAALLAEADRVDAELAGAMAASTRPGPAARPPAPATLPADGIRRWWESLPESVKAALIAADPERYGNYDGIPAADRDVANRAAMTADQDRVADAAARNGVTVEEVLADPERYGLNDTQVTRYRNAAKVADGLPTGALLWAYQPEAFGGQGRAAVATADPDRAEDTTIVVPGTGNSVASGWLTDDAVTNLAAELERAEPGVSHAVIAWMGFDAPDSMTDPRVGLPGLARRGAALLASDVKALSATHVGRGHTTVIGHSYGSTTVADAAVLGMPADDVVLIGSPGTDLANSAADFRLPAGGHVYVGAASTDPITALAGIDGPVGLGADPAADGYGSVRFKSEVPGWTWQVWAEHSGYFEPGSEALYSMADIASGHGDLLQEHRMTAPHRNPGLGALVDRLGLPGVSIAVRDPELGRPGTSGHRH